MTTLNEWLADNTLLTETQVNTLLNGVISYDEWESVLMPMLEIYHGEQYLFEDMVIAETVSQACYIYLYQYKYKYKQLFDSMLSYDLAYNVDKTETITSSRDITDNGTIEGETSVSMTGNSNSTNSQKKNTYDSTTMRETDSNASTDTNNSDSDSTNTQTTDNVHTDDYTETKTYKERNGNITTDILQVRENALLSVIGVIIQDILSSITYNLYSNSIDEEEIYIVN